MRKLQQQKRARRKPPLLTLKGRLITPHFIKTSNNQSFRLNERRDDDLDVEMYWMLKLLKNGRYEVIKRLDPRYCEHSEL